jgi:hypothetical protein
MRLKRRKFKGQILDFQFLFNLIFINIFIDTFSICFSSHFGSNKCWRCSLKLLDKYLGVKALRQIEEPVSDLLLVKEIREVGRDRSVFFPIQSYKDQVMNHKLLTAKKTLRSFVMVGK